MAYGSVAKIQIQIDLKVQSFFFFFKLYTTLNTIWVSICMAESLHCPPETITNMVSQLYSNIK